MSGRRHVKQPNEVLDYDFDFSEWLAQEGDALQASTSTSTITADAGITLTTKTHDVATGRVKQRIAGGTAGQAYKVTCRITSSPSGQEKEAELVLQVQDN